MSSSEKNPTKQVETARKATSYEQSIRETVESVAVAFILAFLFRAFVAEAFVIPTGSMAPTLMGAHKDIVCSHCGQQYQAGASREFDSESGRFTQIVTIASTCSICRGVNAYNLRGNRNHATFSGDRILVSKFDYVLHRPERWDVFVFKYFDKARMNYIKRLVGLPGEQLMLREGDVYTRPAEEDEWTIARKPPDKVKAMRLLLADTERRPAALISQGWPSLWQPLSEVGSSWNLVNTPEQWSASVNQPPPDWDWLRYYHNFVSENDWILGIGGVALPIAPPKTSRLITDYQAYNSSINAPRNEFYKSYRQLDDDVTSENTPLRQVVQASKEALARRGEETEQLNAVFDELLLRDNTRDDGPINDGLHWVGDLTGEFLIDVQSDSGQIATELVEFGIQFRCSFDLATGAATLQALDGGEALELFGPAITPTAQSKVRGQGRYRIEFANVDDQLLVWVNGSLLEFDQSTSFDSHRVRTGDARRPHWTAADPLDAAPVGIGAKNAMVQVVRAKVYRDIYYIAVPEGGSNDMSEYPTQNIPAIAACVPDRNARKRMNAREMIAAIHSTPDWWDNTGLFSLRNQRMFDLEQGQYLPLGDNSAASSDGRAWTEYVGQNWVNHNYIEEEFLLGKALLVFWPHTWNTPIPFTPNFARMGMIR